LASCRRRGSQRAVKTRSAEREVSDLSWRRTAREASRGGLHKLRGCPPRHGFSESTLALEQGGLSLSHQDVCSIARLLALLHHAPRRLPHRLRPKSYFGGQQGAAEEMRTDAGCEVFPTRWTHIRPASEHIGSKFG